MMLNVQRLSTDEVEGFDVQGIYSLFFNNLYPTDGPPVESENGVDLYNPDSYVLEYPNTPHSKNGRINSGIYPLRYFPQKDKHTLSFLTPKDIGYVVADERVSGITGCDGSFYISTKLGSKKYEEGYFTLFNDKSLYPDIEDYLWPTNENRITDIYTKNYDDKYTYIDQILMNQNYDYGEGWDWNHV